jgi:molecular chaperone GrpE
VAEFDNARKRAVREREELIRGANESLIRELLPVLDNFERALQAARGDAGAAGVTAGWSSSSASCSACWRNSG